jgi:hypothetical protein
MLMTYFPRLQLDGGRQGDGQRLTRNPSAIAKMGFFRAARAFTMPEGVVERLDIDTPTRPICCDRATRYFSTLGHRMGLRSCGSCRPTFSPSSSTPERRQNIFLSQASSVPKKPKITLLTALAAAGEEVP